MEDNSVVADAVAEGLRDQGMAVDVAYDGLNGLEKLAVNSYDVVVLDRDLPRLHGDDLCRHMVGSSCPSRVLMLTAAGQVEDRVDGLNLGADDYLPSRSTSPSWWPGCDPWLAAARPHRQC
ncbi:MAG TPA: response regulator [Acidimicrobiales bacterium]|nr:response regulator [Acidimicrobiales bacterium]